MDTRRRAVPRPSGPAGGGGGGNGARSICRDRLDGQDGFQDLRAMDGLVGGRRNCGSTGKKRHWWQRVQLSQDGWRFEVLGSGDFAWCGGAWHGTFEVTVDVRWSVQGRAVWRRRPLLSDEVSKHRFSQRNFPWSRNTMCRESAKSVRTAARILTYACLTHLLLTIVNAVTVIRASAATMFAFSFFAKVPRVMFDKLVLFTPAEPLEEVLLQKLTVVVLCPQSKMKQSNIRDI